MRQEAARFGGALRHRNYRLFFAGQSISLAGTWLTRFAAIWMTYRLTKSPAMLGLVAFFGQAPAALLAPVAGVLVDRWDRRRTMVVTQIAAMLQSVALAAFALTGTMTAWHLLALGAVQAVINAFDTVARQSFLGEMLEDRSDLPNAIAMNSLMLNAARMLGPVLAAALVELFGEGYCFAVDAVSYVPVIASLLAIRVPPRAKVAREGKVGGEMKEGLAYVMGQPLLRTILVAFGAMSVLVGAYTTQLPLVAAETLSGGPHALGILMASAGLGALFGAVVIARRTGNAPKEDDDPSGVPAAAKSAAISSAACAAALGMALLLLEGARSVPLAVPLLFIVGGGWMVQAVATNTVVQTIAAPDKLGRVMSLVAVAFFGGAPVGALLEGQLAKHIGPVHTLAIAGAGSIVCAIVVARTLGSLRRA